MTTLKKPVSRVSNTALDGSYGPDRNRRIVLTLIPGNGRDVPDLLELRPLGTRRPERIAVADVYRLALRYRVACATLEKARDRKARKQARKQARNASRRMNAAQKRLTRRVE